MHYVTKLKKYMGQINQRKKLTEILLSSSLFFKLFNDVSKLSETKVLVKYIAKYL